MGTEWDLNGLLLGYSLDIPVELMGNYNKQFLYWIHAWDFFKESFR